MEKRGILGALMGLLSLKFTSAISSTYTNFDFRSLFYNVDSSFVVYGILFIIFFAVLMFVLGKTLFKENNTIRTIIAFCISALSIYWMVKSPSINLDSILYATPFLDGLLNTLMPFLLTAGFILLGWRFGWNRVLMIAGITAILIATFTDWVYSKGALITIGIIIFLIGYKIHRKKVKNRKYGEMSNYEKWKHDKKQAKREEKARKQWNKAGNKIGYHGSRVGRNLKHTLLGTPEEHKKLKEKLAKRKAKKEKKRKEKQLRKARNKFADERGIEQNAKSIRDLKKQKRKEAKARKKAEKLARQKQAWNKAGRKMGRGIASAGSKVEKKIPKKYKKYFKELGRDVIKFGAARP